MSKHQEFLDNYYAGNWEDALYIARRFANDDNVISGYYQKMVERLIQGCPDDWDGTFRAKTK